MLLRNFLLAGCCLPGIARAAVDFTPRYADILADGVPQHSLFLQDGPQRVFLQAPAKWKVEGDGGALCLSHSEHPTARVDIRPSAIQLPPVVDDKWVKSMTPPLLKSLPKGAENAAVTATKATPIPIISWKSFEFQISYSLLGVKCQRSVCFITLQNKNNIEVVTGGSESDFSPARAAGFSLLGSWLEPPVAVMNRMLQ